MKRDIMIKLSSAVKPVRMAKEFVWDALLSATLITIYTKLGIDVTLGAIARLLKTLTVKNANFRIKIKPKSQNLTSPTCNI